jgi:hypothetical protein
VSAGLLAAISLKTTSTVTVESTSEVNGTAADLYKVISDSGISVAGDVDYMSTSPATVKEATKIYEALTSGVKIFSIVDGAALELAGADVLSAAGYVQYNGTASGKVMDMSFFTLDNLTIDGQAGNDTIYGSLGSDEIIGGSGNDILIGLLGSDTLTGGLGADEYVFSESASTNGTDTIELIIAAGDKLDFSQFLEGGSIDQNSGLSTGILAHTAANASNGNITGMVSLFDTNGLGLDISGVVEQFANGKAYSIDAGGKAVIITGDASNPANPALVYFVDNLLDGSSDVTAADVALVARTSTSFDIDTLKTSNFIA